MGYFIFFYALGAIVLVTAERLTPAEAWIAIDTPTMGLLLGLMVVSAQFRLGGFYTRFTARVAELNVSPPMMLAAVIAAAGTLSALLCNDIICLAMAPVLAEGCVRRKLDPVPFLLALAGAANVGSAATLICNPQNMLIGQVLKLRFDIYLLQAIVPTVLGLAAVWLVICLRTSGQWTRETWSAPGEGRPLDRWQTTKGFLVLGLLVLGFLEFIVQPRLAGRRRFNSLLIVLVMMAMSSVAGLIPFLLFFLVKPA